MSETSSNDKVTQEGQSVKDPPRAPDVWQRLAEDLATLCKRQKQRIKELEAKVAQLEEELNKRR